MEKRVFTLFVQQRARVVLGLSLMKCNISNIYRFFFIYRFTCSHIAQLDYEVIPGIKDILHKKHMWMYVQALHFIFHSCSFVQLPLLKGRPNTLLPPPRSHHPLTLALKASIHRFSMCFAGFEKDGVLRFNSASTPPEALKLHLKKKNTGKIEMQGFGGFL